MDIKNAKELCWKKLVEMNGNIKIKSNPNGSSNNIKTMITEYNYANYLAAFVLQENNWKLKPNPDVKAIDLLGLDTEGNDVAVEVKTEFYPSDNFFLEIADKGKMKDYWNLAKDKQVYYAAICGKTKTLHLFDLSAFRKVNHQFKPVDSKYNTTGFLLQRSNPYTFKVGVYSI